MGVRVVPLTEATLEDAPEWAAHPWSCKYCLYWEHPESVVDPEEESRDDLLAMKRDWIIRVRDEHGTCGSLLYVNDRAVGYAQYAAARFCPTTAHYPSGPVSDRAVFLACLFLPDSAQRRRGLGTHLLKSILGELRLRGVYAVETFARRGNAENPSGPVEFYLNHGFRVLRDDPEFPPVAARAAPGRAVPRCGPVRAAGAAAGRDAKNRS